MKNVFIIAVCVVMMLSGCGTYAGQGAHTGAGFGSILGSAIGGISGGHRGSNIGTIVGMAGGAVVGAAVGSAADKAEQKKLEEYQRQRAAQYGNDAYGMDESGFDPNHGGDDRITFDEAPLAAKSSIEIRNVIFKDNDNDGIISSSEECCVSFEIMNRSSQPICDITPMVTETTGNKRILISPSVRVERIMPGRGVRYTATVLGGRKLKDGEVVIRMSVAQGSNGLTDAGVSALPSEEMRIKTRKN